MTDKIKFFLDGNEVEALADETIWQAASRHGNEIPHLCYSPAPGYRASPNLSSDHLPSVGRGVQCRQPT